MAQFKSNTQTKLDTKADIDANNEVVQLPSGAAAEVTASRPSSVKRADGSWEELRTMHARIGVSTAVSVSSASAFTRLNLDGAIFNDTDGFFSGTNSITLPTGTWLVSASFKINFAANASGTRRAAVYWNGLGLNNSTLVDQPANSGGIGTNIMCGFSNMVIVGDGIKSLDIRASQNSGATLNVLCAYASIKIERIIT